MRTRVPVLVPFLIIIRLSGTPRARSLMVKRSILQHQRWLSCGTSGPYSGVYLPLLRGFSSWCWTFLRQVHQQLLIERSVRNTGGRSGKSTFCTSSLLANFN